MRIDEMNGFFVGMLDEEELEAFNLAIKRGEAMRSYEGASGFMGLAKVRPITKEAQAAKDKAE